jgi:hypothetical protein
MLLPRRGVRDLVIRMARFRRVYKPKPNSSERESWLIQPQWCMSAEVK